MTWSYSGDPSTSDLDAVRFHLQDVDTADQLMTDEELQFVLDQWDGVKGSPIWAASVCADRLAAKFAREVMVSADGVSVSIEALQEKYATLAAQLRSEHKEFYGSAGGPLFGGTIFDDFADPSIKPLSFGVGMHDNPEAGPQNMSPGPDLGVPEDAI